MFPSLYKKYQLFIVIIIKTNKIISGIPSYTVEKYSIIFKKD